MPPEQNSSNSISVLSKKRDLIKQHGIKFKGPVPPSMWPKEHKHHFQVIRDISLQGFDSYIGERGTDLGKSLSHGDWNRIKSLCKKAAGLRGDVRISENDWRRTTEVPILARFSEDVVCPRCKSELWKSEYEAQPYKPEDKTKLRDKRKSRRPCNCKTPDQFEINASADSDEETDPKSFTIRTDTAVSHIPEDNLEKSKVSMIPDAVIGLRKGAKYQEHIASFPVQLTHSPLKGVDTMIYPFLVVEAKRERTTPGFRSIETQTAFPIRRFLKLQIDLQKHSQCDLDPLVWFFAYQGEVWRLYAATYDYKINQFSVFDLWIGSIESLDGALQIFLIVDFIWSWARDVYRPQIRQCLRRQTNTLRGISPTSTVPLSRSQSILSDLGVQSLPQTILDTSNDDNATSHEQDSLLPFRLQDAASHPFLKWADRSLLKPWCIRHCDIVKFSLRVLEIPKAQDTLLSLKNDTDGQAVLTLLLRLIRLRQCTFSFKRRDIRDIGTFWTEGSPQMTEDRPSVDPDELVEAVVFFQTICQLADWQIKREVYFIIWTPDAIEPLIRADQSSGHATTQSNSPQSSYQQRIAKLGKPVSPHLSKIFQSLQQLQSFSAKQSIEFALQMVSLVLLPTNSFTGDQGCIWRRPQDNWVSRPIMDQYFALFRDISSPGTILHSAQYRFTKLLQVVRLQPEPHDIADLEMLDDVPPEDAIVVMKPGFFTDRCPRFCLFVLIDSGFDDRLKLEELLTTELHAGRVRIGSGGKDLIDSERKILRNWLKRMSKD